MRWPVPRLTWPGFQHLPNIPTDESLESQWNCDSSGLFPVFKRNHIIVVDVPSIFHPSLPTENHINIPSKSQKKHINIPSNLLRFPVFLRLHLHPIHLRLRDRELPWIALRAQFFLAKCGGFTGFVWFCLEIGCAYPQMCHLSGQMVIHQWMEWGTILSVRPICWCKNNKIDQGSGLLSLCKEKQNQTKPQRRNAHIPLLNFKDDVHIATLLTTELCSAGSFQSLKDTWWPQTSPKSRKDVWGTSSIWCLVKIHLRWTRMHTIAIPSSSCNCENSILKLWEQQFLRNICTLISHMHLLESL